MIFSPLSHPFENSIKYSAQISELKACVFLDFLILEFEMWDFDLEF
jgi:hypothetical protein